jgi:hypothetical protein
MVRLLVLVEILRQDLNAQGPMTLAPFAILFQD